MANGRTFSQADVAKAAQLSASPKLRVHGGACRRKTHQTEIDGQREFLQNLRNASQKLKDPRQMEQLEQRLSSVSANYPALIDGSSFGTPRGMLAHQSGQNGEDPVSEILENVVETASGVLGGAGSLIEGSTMDIAEKLASGAIDTSVELAEGILGETSNVLYTRMASEYGNLMPRPGVSASVSMSVTVSAPAVGAACASSAQGALETVKSAMDRGIAKLKSLTSIVGKMNGAVDLLSASVQKALDKQIAKMMSKIVKMIKKAHVITHPLFLAIFDMTWSENRQWMPGFGEKGKKWMEPVKELVEHFDFIQKIMGGAINEVFKAGDKLFTEVVKASGGLQVQLNAQVSVKTPKPPLHVPLMSISKQIEDVLKKIQVIKEIIRQKGRQVLEKLKSLQAPELFINLPGDFFLILEVLVEVTVIYSNLHVVLDKILEFFINLLVQKFAELASKLIDKVFSIWKKVVEIVPPIQDLLESCWAIPNTADFCFNCALNIALPEMWSTVEPYVMLPFQCIDMISKACDQATELAYQIPPP